MTDVGIGSGQVPTYIQTEDIDTAEGVSSFGFETPGDTQASANGTGATKQYTPTAGGFVGIPEPDPQIATLNLGHEADALVDIIAENNEDLVKEATQRGDDNNLEENLVKLNIPLSQLESGNQNDGNTDTTPFATQLKENLSDIANKHGTTENDLEWALFSPESASDPKAAAAVKELTGIIGAPPQEDIDNFIIQKSVSYETNFLSGLDNADAAIAQALGIDVKGNDCALCEAKASLKEMFFHEGSSPTNAAKLQGVLSNLKAAANKATGAPAGYEQIVDSFNYDAIQNGFYHDTVLKELINAGLPPHSIKLAQDFLMGKDVKISNGIKAIAQMANKTALEATKAHYNIKTFTPDRTQEASVYLGSSEATKKLGKMIDQLEETVFVFTKLAEKMPDGAEKQSLMSYLALISAALVEIKEMQYQISASDALQAKDALGLKFGMIKDKIAKFEAQQKKTKELRAEQKKQEEEAKEAAEEQKKWGIIVAVVSVVLVVITCGAAGPLVLMASVALMAVMLTLQFVEIDSKGTTPLSFMITKCNEALDKINPHLAAALRIVMVLVIAGVAIASGNPAMLYVAFTIIMQSGAAGRAVEDISQAHGHGELSAETKMWIDLAVMITMIVITMGAAAAGGKEKLIEEGGKGVAKGVVAGSDDAARGGVEAANAGTKGANSAGKLSKLDKIKAVNSKINARWAARINALKPTNPNLRTIIQNIPVAMAVTGTGLGVHAQNKKRLMHLEMANFEQQLATMVKDLAKVESEIEKIEAFIQILAQIIQKLMSSMSGSAEPATEIGNQLDQMWKGASEATTDLVNAVSA